jgi:muramoyltetrapeptide carboxypeptidase LdcA involved in peptidoglycan recycling
MIPPKLKIGDEVRVIAPSRSMAIISQTVRDIAKKKLEKLGLKVTFGNHIEEIDEFNSSSVESRLKDLHEAFADKNVKAILTAIGGFNSNQLLNSIDYNLIRKNPKILCGYSDITILQNALYKKTDLMTYYGPHFSTFGMKKGGEYIEEYFKKCLMSEQPYEITPSKQWSSDAWYINQENRNFKKNEGYWIIQEGSARGKIIGGNASTFNLLHGTEFIPNMNNTILFLEADVEDKDVFVMSFDRYLQSNIHQNGFVTVKGIVIGRFQENSGMTKDKLFKIIASKKELRNIPIIANVDFGHSDPMTTFPIGGLCELEATKSKIKIKILEH